MRCLWRLNYRSGVTEGMRREIVEVCTSARRRWMRRVSHRLREQHYLSGRLGPGIAGLAKLIGPGESACIGESVCVSESLRPGEPFGLGVSLALGVCRVDGEPTA